MKMFGRGAVVRTSGPAKSTSTGCKPVVATLVFCCRYSKNRAWLSSSTTPEDMSRNKRAEGTCDEYRSSTESHASPEVVFAKSFGSCATPKQATASAAYIASKRLDGTDALCDRSLATAKIRSPHSTTVAISCITPCQSNGATAFGKIRNKQAATISTARGVKRFRFEDEAVGTRPRTADRLPAT